MTGAIHGSVLWAGGAILFAVAWFFVKAMIGHLAAHIMLSKARKRGWGRPKKEDRKVSE